MDTVTLGRTGLKISVVALGAGGHSQLGIRKGGSPADAIDLVRGAVDRGVTLLDTAPTYGTEPVIGAALEGLRDRVVLSTKTRVNLPGTPFDGMELYRPAAIRDNVEASLKALRTDRIDILHLHGVRPNQYDYALNQLAPELFKLRDEGKIRFLGITEGFGDDGEHETMRRAVSDGIWDVLMLGYNFVNPSAAELVLPQAHEKNIGVMCMYAVRSALARRETLHAVIQRLVAQGEIDPVALVDNDPADFLLADGVASSLIEAAYRFCRHTPGISVVMTGTGSLDHLHENIVSIHGKPLPADVLRRLATIFGRVRTATGDPESHIRG